MGVKGYAQGGAIYNKAGTSASYMGITSSIFNNNYVEGTLDTTDGGAIWNDGTIDFSGNNYFSGNYKVVNGTKSANDIYNAGTINMLSGSMLDITGGISGNNGIINAGENATLNLYSSQAEGNNMVMSDGASMMIEINNITTDSTEQSGGKFAGDIKLNGVNNLIVQAYIDNSALNKSGEYLFANNVDSSSGSWKLQYTDNGLYNYNLTMTEDSNKNKLEMFYERKTTEEISESLDISKEEAKELENIIGSSSNNKLYEELRQEIDKNAQNKSDNIRNTLNDMRDNPMANISVMRHIEDIMLVTTNNRISSRQNQMNMGLSGGDFEIKNPNVWVSGLYNKSENTGDLDYKTDSYGFVSGIDAKLTRRIIAGVGYGYIKTDMESKNKTIDIDTHSVFGYGEYTKNDWFANLYASYNMHEFNQDKTVLNKLIQGSYDGTTYGAQLMIGKNLYGCPENHYLRLRPSAGLRYYYLEQDGYTDNAGIKYDSVNGDILTGVLGVELTDNMMMGDYPANQKFHVNATYDLVNDNVNTYVQLPNGNGYNIDGQAEDEFGIEAGYGLEVELTDNLSAGVNYEFGWRKNYTTHTAFLNLKYSF